MTRAAKILTLYCLVTAASHGANIVSLAEGMAFYDVTGGNTLTNVAQPNTANALTMNLTFTPDATDIDQATNAICLLEIGGYSNGTGLYLLGGELYFLGKSSSDPSIAVSSFNDLDFTTDGVIGIQTGFNLSAGQEYSVGVIYDPNGSGTVEIGVLPTSGSLSQSSWNLTLSGAVNWSGNETVTSFNNPGDGGAANNVGGDPFNQANMNALSGTAGRALMWNQGGTLIPEPSAAILTGLGSLLLLHRKR